MMKFVDSCVDFLFEKIVHANDISSLKIKQKIILQKENEKTNEEFLNDVIPPSQDLTLIQKKRNSRVRKNDDINLSIITQSENHDIDLSKKVLPLKSSRINKDVNDSSLLEITDIVGIMSSDRLNDGANNNSEISKLDNSNSLFLGKDNDDHIQYTKQDTPKFINLKVRDPGTLKKMFGTRKNIKNKKSEKEVQNESVSYYYDDYNEPFNGLDKLVEENFVLDKDKKVSDDKKEGILKRPEDKLNSSIKKSSNKLITFKKITTKS